MRRRYRIVITASRAATTAEKDRLGVTVIEEKHSENVMAFDLDDAKEKGITVAKRRWPKAKDWDNHSVIV